MSGTASKLAEVARALNAAHPQGADLPAIIFLTDDQRTQDPVAAIEHLPEGCAVIFRHYDHPDRTVMAGGVVAACHKAGRLCLIAGDAEMAAQTNADGVHLPEYMIRTRMNWAQDGWLVTAAAHTSEALGDASARGVDACLLSPVFTTASHDDANPLGIDQFTDLVRGTELPVYALGGLNMNTAPDLLHSGAVGLAAIGGLLG